MIDKSDKEEPPMLVEESSDHDENTQIEEQKLSWEEYKHHIDMYKFYIELGLKANVFFFAIVGAILSVLYHTITLKDGNVLIVIATLPRSVVALFLKIPFFISVVFALIFLLGAIWWGKGVHEINQKVKNKRTEVQIVVTQNLQLLTYLLVVFSLIFFFIAKYLSDIMQSNNISIC